MRTLARVRAQLDIGLERAERVERELGDLYARWDALDSVGK